MLRLFPFRPRLHDCEWLGGRYKLPKPVRDGDALVYPEVDLWLELPRDVVVGSQIANPRNGVSFGDGLKAVMKQPTEGSPRRPARIRVAEERLADAVRGVVGGDVAVVVAPVPELDAAFAELAGVIGAPAPVPTYLGGGAIPPAVVADLFAAASILFRIAPWRRVAEEQILRVDIPSIAIDGACLSIIGGADESFGLLLFRSLDAYDAFAAGPPAPGKKPRAAAAVRETALLSLSFDRKKDLPPEMLEEIKQHRWEVAGAKAYPVVFAIDADAEPMAMTERDVRILTACTLAFLAFFARHRDLFEDDLPEQTSESFSGDDDMVVTLTAPYGADEHFDVERFFAPDEPARPSVGRNDPCPCGSGKKYKKCHLAADTASPRTAPDADSVHEMDFHLVRAIGRFASARFGDEWIGELDEEEASLQLFVPWVAWTAVADGKRVAQWYLEENEARLSVEQREWFAAQERAWLGIWEATAVTPGTIEVRDLLTGERRAVQEVLGSRTAVTRDTVLARVIDFRGRSIFGGMHGRPLPPTEAAEVVRVVHAKLRARGGDVPVDRLRDPRIGRFLIDRWADAVAERDERASRPPVLQNTDGDPLLFVKESFSFDAARRAEIETRIAAMDEVDDVQRSKRETAVTFVRTRDKTVTGRVMVGRDWLRIETNSERRADALRRRVRSACGTMLRDGERTTEDASSMLATAREATKPAPRMTPREEVLLGQVKEAHYHDWIDQPIPALGGKTPRAAARSAKSRQSLDLLLRDIENHENRLPERARFDVGRLRKELGMEE